MNKISKIIVLIMGALVFSVALMAIFKICPPKGPWPTPPWCSIQEANSSFNYSKLPYIEDDSSKGLKNNFMFGMGMMDLWGNLCTSPFTCEDPMDYMDQSFKRLNQLHTDLVMVTDFYQIDRNKNILEVSQGGAQTISPEDMKLLVDKAHENDMKFMLMTNLYEKDNSREVLNFNNPSKQEVDNLFEEWKAKILDQAQKADYDYMAINPRDINFFFGNEEDNTYINNKLIELIPEIRKSYSGDICLWGPPSWIKNFGTNYDCIIVDESINRIFTEDSEDLGTITNKWSEFLNRLNYNKPTFVLILMPSYEGALTNGWIEPVGKDYGSKYTSDYKVQALVYEGFFRAAANLPEIDGVISYGYWWNDQVYPNTLDIFRNDLSHSIRDKDAESVFYKWANGLD